MPADIAFIDAFRQQELARKRRREMVTPVRKNMPHTLPVRFRRICRPWRNLVETVASQLTEGYSIARTRTHDLWHYQHRLIPKVLSHTIYVFINLLLGRSPLALDDLITH